MIVGKQTLLFTFAISCLSVYSNPLTLPHDSIDNKLNEAVITGTRVPTDKRHLPATIFVL